MLYNLPAYTAVNYDEIAHCASLNWIPSWSKLNKIKREGWYRLYTRSRAVVWRKSRRWIYRLKRPALSSIDTNERFLIAKFGLEWLLFCNMLTCSTHLRITESFYVSKRKRKGKLCCTASCLFVIYFQMKSSICRWELSNEKVTSVYTSQLRWTSARYHNLWRPTWVQIAMQLLV